MRRIFTLVLLLVGLHSLVSAQTTNGIHVKRGCSYDSIVSSNIGTACNATGQYSFAGGFQTHASGQASFAFGISSQATQKNSFAFGQSVQATHQNTFVIGQNAEASQQCSFAMGKGVQASGSYSMLFGFYVSAQQNRCIVIGSGVDSQNPMAVTSSGITLGMGSTLPTMYVSEASGAQKTGKVAIGNVTPVAKLHIRSDANEDAGVILEAGDPTGNGAYIQFKDTAHHITVDTGGNMSISAGDYDTLGVTSKNFKLSDCLIDLGVSEERHLTFSTQGVPSIGCNAYPVTEGYSRNSHGPSYVFEFGSSGLLLRTATYSDPRYNLITNWKNALSVKTDGAVTLNGRVGVNTENSTTDYALAVDGGILTTKVHIQDVNDWPDYVFEDDYQSIPISELKEYIAVYRHLPGVPSEAEVRERGYDVSGMQAVLLEKIEELTLYMLRQQEEIDSLRTLVTVSFGYDACGNRTSRAITFKGMDDGGGGTPRDDDSDSHTSLRDSFSGGEALLFPNPTEGGFVLSLIGGDIPQATAVLCTMEGKVIEERVVKGTVEEFDLSGKPAGVYLLRLTTEGEAKVWKVIKRN